MDSIFELIYKGFEKHGFTYIFQVLLLFIIVGSIILGFLWIKNKISNNSNGVNVTVNIDDHTHASEQTEEEFNHHGHSCKELMNHSFFRTVQKMINYEIHHIDIKERLRRAVFRDFLLIKFTVIQDKIRSFVLSGDMDLMSSDVFHNKLHALITEIIREYESIALQQGIPDIVVNKFNKWHQDKAEIVYNFVNDICEADDWYVSNSVKFYSFLNQMVSILDLTLIDARKTLIALNGDLSKLIYKGISAEKYIKSERSDSYNIGDKSDV